MKDVLILALAIKKNFNFLKMYLRRRIYGEAKLRFFPIINRQALQQQRTKARSSATTDCIKNEEPLQPSAVVCQLTHTVKT